MFFIKKMCEGVPRNQLFPNDNQAATPDHWALFFLDKSDKLLCQTYTTYAKAKQALLDGRSLGGYPTDYRRYPDRYPIWCETVARLTK